MAADVEGEAVEARGVEEEDVGNRPIASRLPAMDEDDPRARRASSRRYEPGGERTRPRWNGRLLERQAEVRRTEPGRPTSGLARADPIDEREAIGEGQGRGGERSGDPRAA